MPPPASSAIKQSLHHTTLTLLNCRIAALERTIADLQAAANEEDKSSANECHRFSDPLLLFGI